MDFLKITLRKINLRSQPGTFAIRTSHTENKNGKGACPFANAFLPKLKTNFLRNSSASFERISDCNSLIIN
jgi:hypothetical protein